MTSIALLNNYPVKEKSVLSGNGETFNLENCRQDNSLTVPDSFSFKSENKYTFSRGLAAAAKIGIGLAASDLAVQQIYPGQSDKRLHSLAGGVISGVAGEVTTALTDKKWVGILVGIGTGVLAGAAKEFVDMQGYGDPDRHDFFATSLGSATVGLSLTLPF